MKKADLIVIGGGCIGMAIAGRLAEDLERVLLFDRDYLGREATHASGGMLAPIMELEFEEFDLLELGVASLNRYPDFVRRLQSVVDMNLDYRREGTIFTALQPRQASELNRLYEYQERIGLEVEKISAARLRGIEPLLAEEVREGLLVESEQKIDNRKLSTALALYCREQGVEIHSNEPVVDIEYTADGNIRAVRSELGEYPLEKLLVAAGAWSGMLPGLEEKDRLPFRPVKGQAAAVGIDPGFAPDHVIQTPDVYCVPHYPDRLLLGATMEEKGFESKERVGGAYDLLFAAAEVLPGIKEQPFLESWVGHRPATVDSLPVIGPSSATPNLFFAAGHYRNGILLVPVTVELVREIILADNIPEQAEPFLPQRFQK